MIRLTQDHRPHLSLLTGVLVVGVSLPVLAESRRVLVRSTTACSSLPTIPKLGSATPLVPSSPAYPSAALLPPLDKYCVYEMVSGTSDAEAEHELAPFASAFDAAAEILPLELHRQSVSALALSEHHAEAAHAEFLNVAEAWDSATGSATPQAVRVIVVDDVSRLEAEAACPGGAGLCADWPVHLSMQDGVSHGTAMAEIVRELACPLSNSGCAVSVEPELALDTNIGAGWAQGNQYGDAVSLIRALLRIVQSAAGTSTPVVVNISLGFDEGHLGPEADQVLATAVGILQDAGVALLMAAGNAHHAGGTAVTGLLAPAKLHERVLASPPTSIRPVVDGVIIPVAAVNSSFAPLSMSQLANRAHAYINEGHFLAPGMHAAPLAATKDPRIYTGTSVATAVASATFAVAWNLFPADTGDQLYMRVAGLGPMLERCPVTVRFTQTGLGYLPVFTAASVLEHLYPTVAPSWGFSFARPSSSHAHLSPRARALDAFHTMSGPSGSTTSWTSPLSPAPEALERGAQLRAQPDPIGCDICAVLNSDVIVELAPPHVGLQPVEIILATDHGEEIFPILPNAVSPYLVQPQGQQTYAGRVVVLDPSAGASMSVELDVVN